jgi:hypothetical protein
VPARLTAATLVTVPLLALGPLLWYAAVVAGQADATCADWAVQYRHARDDLATVNRLWRSAHPGGPRPPDRRDFADRVSTLASARPPRCDDNGRHP